MLSSRRWKHYYEGLPCHDCPELTSSKFECGADLSVQQSCDALTLDLTKMLGSMINLSAAAYTRGTPSVSPQSDAQPVCYNNNLVVRLALTTILALCFAAMRNALGAMTRLRSRFVCSLQVLFFLRRLLLPHEPPYASSLAQRSVGRNFRHYFG